MASSLPLAFLSLPNGSEWIIILALGLLLFGRRLPEVGRSIGRSIVEFKKGIKGIEDEIEQESGPASKPRLSERSSVGSTQQSAVHTPASAPHDAP